MNIYSYLESNLLFEFDTNWVDITSTFVNRNLQNMATLAANADENTYEILKQVSNNNVLFKNKIDKLLNMFGTNGRAISSNDLRNMPKLIMALSINAVSPSEDDSTLTSNAESEFDSMSALFTTMPRGAKVKMKDMIKNFRRMNLKEEVPENAAKIVKDLGDNIIKFSTGIDLNDVPDDNVEEELPSKSQIISEPKKKKRRKKKVNNNNNNNEIAPAEKEEESSGFLSSIGSILKKSAENFMSGNVSLFYKIGLIGGIGLIIAGIMKGVYDKDKKLSLIKNISTFKLLMEYVKSSFNIITYVGLLVTLLFLAFIYFAKNEAKKK